MRSVVRPGDDTQIETGAFPHVTSHPLTSLRPLRLLFWVRARLAPLTLIALIAADFLLLGGLALQRHATFQTNALDLGYHDQAIWNTLHGRPFRFTTYQQDERASFAVDVPLAQIRDPHSLLSYHVEPLLLLIAPIFLIWDDARALLVLQAAALALGAWPAFRLGSRRLGSPWAGIAMALLYLLAPARQAAALSDFHTVAFTAPLFLLALDALDAQKVRLFLGASLLCLLAREDAAIIVIALALYAALRPKFRRPALTLAGVALLNALANTGWPSSGGAHYSAAIVPFLVAAATYGIARLKRWVEGGRKAWKIADSRSKMEDSKGEIENRSHFHSSFSSTLRVHPLSSIHYLLLLALVVALGFQFQQGTFPFSSRWSWPPLDTHARLGAKILSLVPPEAAVSAQSGLYPHLSHRRQVYQFPTIADADYIVLDVTNNPVTLTYEGYFQHVRLALINPRFGPLAAGDGYLVLKRGAPKKSPLVDEFLTFSLAQPAEIEHPLQADFGGQLRLEGYTLTILPVIDQRGPHVQLTTFWRTLGTPPENLRPVFFFTRADGAIVYQQPEPPLELYWRPSGAWQAGQLYRLTNPELRVDALREVLLGVESTDGNPGKPTHRLEIKATQAGVTPNPAEQGTLLRLLELPK